MTKLCEMTMECRAIGIDDRVILYGWAAQLDEGNDILYCSKETVAVFLGTSISTVQRRTKSLLAAGWLVDTGERKQWATGLMPVYTINVPMIVGILEASPVNLTAPIKMKPVQIDRQGSLGLSGSRFTGLCSSVSSSVSLGSSSGTGVPPAALILESKETGKPETENPEPRTAEPKPSPTSVSHAHSKETPATQSKRLCPECREPLQRDVNHFLACKVAKGKSTLDEYLGDMPLRPTLDSMGEMMDFDDDGYSTEPLFPSINSPQAKAARQRVDAERQKSVQSRPEEERTIPAATPFAQSPRSAAPPQDEFPDDIWDAQGRTKDTPAGRAWAASRGEEIIKPTSINP